MLRTHRSSSQTDLFSRAHETGTFVAVYNVHAAPHVPVDRDTIGADVLTCSAYRFFGPQVGVMPPRVYEIVRGERAVSADTALRLGRCFGTGPKFWLNLRSHYDLEVARDRAGEKVEREVRPLSPA
jgi:addiction module HigA family antidote